jgi:ABC-2 type transport system permease protein
MAEFSSVDTLFASATTPIKLTAFMTPKTLPEQLKEAPEKLKKVTDELVKEAKGKLVYKLVEPKIASLSETSDERAATEAEAEAQDILTRYGFRPVQLGLADRPFYFYLVVEREGGRPAPVLLPKEASEAAYRTAITDVLKRGAPGFRRVVGLWTPPAGPPMGGGMEGMPQQQMPPAQAFQQLRKTLDETYEVRSVALDARLPEDMGVVLLAGPSNLDAKALENLDQFVMRGGSLIVLSGGSRLVADPFRGGLRVEKVTSGLDALLEKWGIKLAPETVMDDKNESFMLPQQRDLGNGLAMEEYVKKPSVVLVRVGSNQLSSSAITSGVRGAVVPFASPVSADEKVGEDAHKVDVLLRSSDGSWLSKSPEVPNWEAHPEGGAPGPGKDDELRGRPLAVTVAGRFASGVAKPAGKSAGSAAQQQLVERSPDGTRIAVFGSSTFVSDLFFKLRLNSDLVVSNVQLVHNAIDWALSDTDLLAIRARNPAARAITLEEGSRNTWILINFLIAFFALAAVVVLAWVRRSAVTPIISAKEV